MSAEQKDSTQFLEYKNSNTPELETQESNASKLLKIKQQLIHIWNQFQPKSQKYTQVTTMQHLDKGFNLYGLTSQEHENLSVVISLILQVCDDLAPSFSNMKPPQGWIPLDHRHSPTTFTTCVNKNTIINAQLHVELISLPSIQDQKHYRATSLMNSLLILFVESFATVVKEKVLPKFCSYLIPADEDNGCINARVRMAFDFAGSDEISAPLFSDLFEAINQAEDCNTDSYFAVIAYFIDHYWGKSFKADTGKNAICTPDDIKKTGKKITVSTAPVIDKGIRSILLVDPGCDFIIHHERLKPEQKFAFFRIVLKYRECIKPLSEIEIESKDQPGLQNSYDRLMLTRHPINGKTILGFAAMDCEADEKTLGILLANLSDGVFKQAIVDGGILWEGASRLYITNRLRQLKFEDLSQILNDFWQSATRFDLVNHRLDKIRKIMRFSDHETYVFSAMQYIFPLLHDCNTFHETAQFIQSYVPRPRFIEIIYYSGIIKSRLEMEGPEGIGALRQLSSLFSNTEEIEYKPQQRSIFDSVMNTCSELRDKNFFGFLVGEQKIPVLHLIKHMSAAGVIQVVKKCCLLWSNKDLSTVLEKIKNLPHQILPMLYSMPSNNLFIRESGPALRENLKEKIKLIALYIPLIELLKLLEQQGIFNLIYENAELYAFLIQQIIDSMQADKEKSCADLLVFLHQNNLLPVIKNKDDTLNKGKLKSLLIVLDETAKFLRTKSSPEVQKLYDDILSMLIPEMNTSILGYLELHCEGFVTSHPTLVSSISPATFAIVLNNANVCWSSTVLTTILVRLNDREKAYAFLKNGNQLFNDAGEWHYFYTNLPIVIKYLNINQLIEILSKSPTKFNSLFKAGERFSNFIDVLKKVYAPVEILKLVNTLKLISPDQLEQSLSTEIQKLNVLMPVISSEEKLDDQGKAHYNAFLSISLPKKNTNIMGFLELFSKEDISSNLSIIRKLKPNELLNCVLSANVCWGPKALAVILETLHDREKVYSFLKKGDQLFNDAGEWHYFYTNLPIVIKHLNIEQLISVFQTHQTKLVKFLRDDNHLCNIVCILSQNLDSVSINLLFSKFPFIESCDNPIDIQKQTTQKKESKPPASFPLYNENLVNREAEKKSTENIDPHRQKLKLYISKQLSRLSSDKESNKYKTFFGIQEKLNTNKESTFKLFNETDDAAGKHRDTGFLGLLKFNCFRKPQSFHEFRRDFDNIPRS